MPMPQSESDDLSNMPDIDNASGGIKSPIMNNPAFSHSKCPTEIHRSCFCVRFIAEHTKLLEDSTKVSKIIIIMYKPHASHKIFKMVRTFFIVCNPHPPSQFNNKYNSKQRLPNEEFKDEEKKKKLSECFVYVFLFTIH